jgi:putative aldouronate transport system permease protein
MRKSVSTELKRKKRSILKNNMYLLILILPAFVYYVVFAIFPMYGLVLAFKTFRPGMGIWGSPWADPWYANFKFFLTLPTFKQLLFNTIFISVGRIILGFWVPILFAVLLNEMRFKRFKKVSQTILTFPHFLSWVVISGYVAILFSENSGVVNSLITALGGESKNFLTSGNSFLLIVFLSDIWKEAGWGAIVYLAVISGIDPELYEAAKIDGASRFRRILHITLPGIKQMAILMLLLNVGDIMNAGFDQIFNLYNPLVYDRADIIDTFIFRIVFSTSTINQGVGAAVGMFKSVIGFFILIAADRIAKWCGERGIF